MRAATGTALGSSTTRLVGTPTPAWGHPCTGHSQVALRFCKGGGLLPARCSHHLLTVPSYLEQGFVVFFFFQTYKMSVCQSNRSVYSKSHLYSAHHQNERKKIAPENKSMTGRRRHEPLKKQRAPCMYSAKGGAGHKSFLLTFHISSAFIRTISTDLPLGWHFLRSEAPLKRKDFMSHVCT